MSERPGSADRGAASELKNRKVQNWVPAAHLAATGTPRYCRLWILSGELRTLENYCGR